MILALAVLAVYSLVAISSNSSESKVESTDRNDLPQVLDNLYPPESPAPVYFLSMLKMAGHFSGIASDLMEGDIENARSNYEAFKQEYFVSAEFVPEWKEFYSDDAVTQLGEALESDDIGNIMASFEKVGATCFNCHEQKMTQVYFKYHWKDFYSIEEIDPVSGEKVSYSKLMQLVELDLNGIGNDLGQNQISNAIAHVEQLEQRYEAMEETCYACHDSEREYYVDDEITDIFKSLKSKLSEPDINLDEIGKMVQTIGMESCYKCHLVHVPAAFSK
jgi:hypothetical protein